jgi:PHP family Zn ribbon phosphoesterase
MNIVADLQLHSRFSRAVSQAMTLPNIALWARRKGIDLVATGDWTHPTWFREIERDLEETGSGLLRLKSSVTHPEPDPFPDRPNPQFLLATEVSCIYSQGGKVRRVHTLIWVPSIASARKISAAMVKRGCNLMSDGRPIVGLTSIQIAELVFTEEPDALIIPAHAWTPWFSVYGSLGGFDSISEAFGPYADRIYAVETGLSSNPSMNWRIEELDRRAIVSFSDAHSGPKLGREATVFDLPDNKLSYRAISDAIKGVGKGGIAYTIEFYPEEGKYHFTGHRACKIRQTPSETAEKGTTCPVCGKPLTVGVMHRIDALASRDEKALDIIEVSAPLGINAIFYGSRTYAKRPPYTMVVPLLEIIAEAIGSPVTSPKVQGPYFRLTESVGTEFYVLLSAAESDIAAVAGKKVAEAVGRVRKGMLHIDPGYDGVFGVVKIWADGEKGIADSRQQQLSLLV